jgi:hypothetical protein
MMTAMAIPMKSSGAYVVAGRRVLRNYVAMASIMIVMAVWKKSVAA